MTNKKVETLLNRIQSLKDELHQVKAMRPGSVTKQMRKRGKKKWECWQISYTFDRQSKTEYVREEFLPQMQAEVMEYKKFKDLVEKLVRINIELSKERIKLLKEKSNT
jgi:hypothetical protein